MAALVMRDDQDALVPSEVGLQLAAGLLRAQFNVLQGFGHLPTSEKPAESTAILTKLLAPA
jgi:pimeloyl-ACP methyl ester carboxylesterase